MELRIMSVRDCVKFPLVGRSFPVDADEPSCAIHDRVADSMLSDQTWSALLLRSVRRSAATSSLESIEEPLSTAPPA